MGDLIGQSINWELMKVVNESPDDVRLWIGTYRCISCAHSTSAVVHSPDWAAGPPSWECECGGHMLRVDPEVDETADELLRVVPKYQEHLAE